MKKLFCFFAMSLFFDVADISLHATTAEEYLRAANLKARQGDCASAVRYAEEAVRLDPKNPEAYKIKAWCLKKMGKNREALTAQKKAEHLERGKNTESNAGGDFGIGLVVGEPGDWGITVKFWMNDAKAFQAMLNVDGGVVLSADFLWHREDLVRPEKGNFPWYLGVGGAVAFEGEAFAVRGPFGLTYLFETAPVDLFVEIVPTLWFFSSGSDFKFDAGFGARYYP